MERTVQQEAAWLINPANNAKDYVFNIARAHGVPEGYLDVYAHAYVSAILTIAYSEEAARVIADWKEWKDFYWDNQASGEVRKDQMNNHHGREAGKKLIQEKGGAENVTRNDVEQEALRKWNQGELQEEQIRPEDWSLIPPPPPYLAPDPSWLRQGSPIKPPPWLRDPLVIDFDGDGLELIASDVPAAPYFDMDGDGFLERIGWVQADDGLLVRDIGADGRITTAAELFGDESSAVGFAALALLDSNSDGQLDAADAAFAELRVWRDANMNAVVDAGGVADARCSRGGID